MTVLAVFAVVALLLVTFVHSPFGLSLRGAVQQRRGWPRSATGPACTATSPG